MTILAAATVAITTLFLTLLILTTTVQAQPQFPRAQPVPDPSPFQNLTLGTGNNMTMTGALEEMQQAVQDIKEMNATARERSNTFMGNILENIESADSLDKLVAECDILEEPENTELSSKEQAECSQRVTGESLDELRQEVEK